MKVRKLWITKNKARFKEEVGRGGGEKRERERTSEGGRKRGEREYE